MKPAAAVPKLNGIRVHRVHSTIFIPLPRELWEPIDGCGCGYCTADHKQPNPEAYWDTLAVSTAVHDQTSWTVHAPELHGVKRKRKEGT